MGSIQLLCGWAAGALPQNQATARAAFFDALLAARDLDGWAGCLFGTCLTPMVDQVRVVLQHWGHQPGGRGGPERLPCVKLRFC